MRDHSRPCRPTLSSCGSPGRHSRDTNVHAHRAVDSAGRPVRLRSRPGGDHRPADPRSPRPLLDRIRADRDAEYGWLEFLIKVEPSGRWGHRSSRITPGMTAGHSGTVRLVHISRPGRRRPFPLHRRRYRHRANPGDDRQALLTTGRAGCGCSTAPRPPTISPISRARRDGRKRRPRPAPARDPRSARDVGQRARIGGRITPIQLAPLIDDPATLCFVCGPETMVADVPRMLMELGIDRARVRLEEW